MKKPGFRSGFFIIALLIVMVYLLRDRSPFGEGNTSFAVKEGIEITGIDLIREGQEVSLRKSGNDWIIDDGRAVRKQDVLMLVRIISAMEIKSPVNAGSFEEEIIKKNIAPVRVNAYKKRRLVKSFYVYGTSSNIYGNMMKIRVNSKPFIVYLPGYEGDIGRYFNADERFWQHYTVFAYLPSEISSIDFQNQRDPDSSFRIEFKNGVFKLADNAGYLAGWDTTRVKRYITYFTSVQFEQWATELNHLQADSIIRLEPLYRITLTETGGIERLLNVWERSVFKEGNQVNDTDRLWGETDNDGQLFVIRYFDLDPLIKKKSYFFDR